MDGAVRKGRSDIPEKPNKMEKGWRERDRSERHLVLVHGACHGGWCWYKVVPTLKAAGHKVTVLDMAASGIHPKQVQELSSITDYVEPLMQFMGDLDQNQRVILVGHSLGGLCISMAMQLFPHKIAAAVFVAAFMPSPHLPFITLLHQYYRQLDSNMDSKIVHDEGPNNHPNGYLLFGPKFLASKLYQLSPVEDLCLAQSLLRPSRVYGDEEVLMEKTKVTEEKFGSVRRVYIVCEQDKVLTQDFQMWMISQINTNEDIEVIVANHADHMLMFSKPQHLASSLLHIASTYY